MRASSGLPFETVVVELNAARLAGMIRPLRRNAKPRTARLASRVPSSSARYNRPVSLRAVIETKLRAALDPVHLEILDESGMHAVPKGSESHFRLRVVSRAFDGQRLVERHRAVNRVLAAELARSIHALALEPSRPRSGSRAAARCRSRRPVSAATPARLTDPARSP